MKSDNRLASVGLSALSTPFGGLLDCSAIEFNPFAALSHSEHVDRWKSRLSRRAVPQIDGKPGVACPERIAAASERRPSSSNLIDGGHRERSRALQPERILRSSVELQESVAVATGTMAQIRSLH